MSACESLARKRNDWHPHPEGFASGQPAGVRLRVEGEVHLLIGAQQFDVWRPAGKYDSFFGDGLLVKSLEEPQLNLRVIEPTAFEEQSGFRYAAKNLGPCLDRRWRKLCRLIV